MHEGVLLVGAEKLAKVEDFVLIGEAIHQSAQVVGVNMHGRQRRIGVGIADMVLVPRHFGALLHDIVPGEDLVFVILVEEVEGRARKLQHFGVGMPKLVDHRLPQFGLRALVCFVDNEQIPVGGEDVVVFFVLSAHVFRSAQVLHGGKTHNVRTFVGLQQQLVEALPLLRRTVVVFSLQFALFRCARALAAVGNGLSGTQIIEYFFKVLIPSGIDHGAMRDNEGASGTHLAHHLQRREGFAETHLAVPKHFALPLAFVLGEMLHRLVDGFALFGAKDDGGGLVLRLLLGKETAAPLLGGGNGIFHGGQIRLEPFFAEAFVRKFGASNTRTEQNTVHLLVVERLQDTLVDKSGALGVEQLIFYGRRFRVLVDSLACRCDEQGVVGCGQLFAVFGQLGHADFQAPFVQRVVCGEDINDLRQHRTGVGRHRLGMDLGKKRGRERDRCRV